MKKNLINISLLTILFVLIQACGNPKKTEKEKAKRVPLQALNEDELNQQPDFKSLEEALKRPEKAYRLDLSEKGLKEISDIQQLTRLQRLYLDKNPELNWAKTFEALSELPLLQELGLSENQLKVLPSEITKLKSLKAIWLDFNPQLQIEPTIDLLAELPQLQELFLQSNQIKLLPENIGKLKNLKRLALGYNQLKEMPFKIAGLQQLEVIELMHNPNLNLKRLFEQLAPLKNLKRLILSNCKQPELPKEVALLENIELLVLDGNLFETLPEELNRLKKLKKIILYNNPLDPMFAKNLQKFLPKVEIEFDTPV
ncbi:MAG: hypothetical protein NZ551_09055 [Microscillaceae bacterium]|nr:hypothetical protein [Microscillaceae bacterium]MDW8461347.1 hypothetical protein [Cytophagales bacterium]